MSTHEPRYVANSPYRRYLRCLEEILDEYKHGQLTWESALQLYQEQAAILEQHWRAAFMVRLRNLEAFRVNRGQLVLPAVPGEQADG